MRGPSALAPRLLSGRRPPAAFALVAALAMACTGGPAPAPQPPVDPQELPFLLSPVDGAPRPGAPELLRRVAAAYQGLLGGRAAGAAATARELLALDPELDPAQVLLAQALALGGELAAARDLLAPLVRRFPDYAAARLLAARVDERLGDLVGAYAGYRSLPGLAAAAERAATLRERAVEVLAQRVQEGLRRSRLDEAREPLALLSEWAPGEIGTLQAAMVVARAADEPRSELTAVRGLLVAGAGDESLLERRGELELRVGEPRAAIEIYEELLRRHPGDGRLADRLDLAKFQWRAVNLPEEVRRLLDKPELLRGDFAVLLYWLVPGVRAGVAPSPRIATDVLDHPQRQAIVRVINLQLLDVDQTLRRFDPDLRLRRVHALRALLRVLQRSPSPPSCVGGLESNPTPSREALCSAAAACGLLPEPADCLSEAGLAGREAADWIRRALALLPR